jgi:hypothetical protein
VLTRPVEQQAQLIQYVSTNEYLICVVIAYDLDAWQGQSADFDVDQIRANTAPTSGVASHCLKGNNACFQLPDDPNWQDGRISPSIEKGADRTKSGAMR